MRTLRGLLVALLLAPAFAAGDEPVATLTSDVGEIRFTARYEGQALEGVFRRFRVELQLAGPEDRPRGLRVTVATGSADMNDADVNDELRKPDFFDVASFPEAVFQSDTITRIDAGGHAATGSIEIKGLRQPLTVPLRLRRTGGSLVLEGTVEVSRGAWRVGLGEWSGTDLIADEVEIRYRIEFPGAPG